MILATDLPDYEPLVYLRPRNKKEYLKMVQDKEGNFKFERRTPPKVGFFLWLESIGPTLGSRITTQSSCRIFTVIERSTTHQFPDVATVIAGREIAP